MSDLKPDTLSSTIQNITEYKNKFSSNAVHIDTWFSFLPLKINENGNKTQKCWPWVSNLKR